MQNTDLNQQHEKGCVQSVAVTTCSCSYKS